MILICLVKNGLSPGVSPHPNNDQGVATELTWHSMAFIQRFSWQFSALSLRFHSAQNACIALSLRSNCTDGVAC